MVMIPIRHQKCVSPWKLRRRNIYGATTGFCCSEKSRGYVCLLVKALYGLKQSPRVWFVRFSAIIRLFGIIWTEANHSMFYRCYSNKYIYLVVCVDDIVITHDDHDGITGLEYLLIRHFQTKYLGQL